MSSQYEKDENEAADILATPSAVLQPISDVKQEGSPAVEVEVADSLLVTWDGDSDPYHSFNWPRPRKWAITILLSNSGLVTLMSGAMLTPPLHMFLSIFILAFAFGPMVLSPFAEVFGRRPVWILSSCFYILWNTIAGFSRTPGLMIASRVLSGIGASAEFAMTQPVLSDCWVPDERGNSYAIATFIPLLGPAIGPIIGGAVTQSIGWQWTFQILSIYDATLENPTLQMPIASPKAWGVKLSRSLLRPLRLLLTQQILQVVAIFLAYNFGILYIVLSTFATLWIQRYGQTESQSGFHYIALVIGYTIAAQVGGKVMDCLWRYLKARSGENTAPEYRVPLVVPGAVPIPLGFLLYGWTAERHTHWIAPGIRGADAYVIEAFRRYVASASAAAQFLHSIADLAFLIFAPMMYRTLGYGWGNSILALTFVVIEWPAPFLLWRYGGRLRAMGKPQW
ncbi:putative drug/proton antiporter YHK8 [Madurella mycetomatis]|uniref:Drug/proton antiporter YHK8 n=1 Tax=Madurella mycetomatis TaxID=100816 RepID=A0A175VUP2_9PEZI|nr:putative drug/proton antiporter YHK8 [Madurella mycetomatis]